MAYRFRRYEHGQIHDRRGHLLFEDVVRPVSFASRAQGLIGKPVLGETQAYWFDRCASVHTWGMASAIDVIYLNTSGVVIKVVSELQPFRFSAYTNVATTVELAGGTASRREITVGQTLVYRPLSATSHSMAKQTPIRQ